MSPVSLEDVYNMAMQLSPEERRQLADSLIGTQAGADAQRVLDVLNEHAGQLRQFGVTRIGVFGSHVRGEATLDSDVDILVSLAEHTFDAFMDVKLYLEDLLGQEVDLVLESSLKPELRPYIMEEVRYAEGV